MISTSGLLYALTLVTTLGCGTIAGVFFAFSTFVMKALARLPPEEGIAAMQSINVFAINSWFLVAFLGTAAFCVATTIAAVVQWSEPFAIFLLLGGVVYLVLPPTAPDRTARWASYVSGWTTWNHVRTAASLLAAALLAIGLSRIA